MRNSYSNGFCFICALACILLVAACTQSAEQLWESARERQARGDRTGAIFDLKSALQLKPDDASMRFHLGQLYNETFDAVSAEKELRRAIELGAVEGGRVSVQLARALRAQGRHKDVLEDVKLSEVYEPEQIATIHALRGRSQYALRQLASAKESLSAAEKIQAGTADARLLAAAIEVAEGRLDRAHEELSALLEEQKHHFDGLRLRAQLFHMQGEEEKALKAYSDLLGVHPTYFGGLVDRSNLLMLQGRLEEAKRDVDLLTQTYKGHPNGIIQRAKLLLAQGKSRDALEVTQILMKSSSPPANAIFLAGLVHYQLGSINQAESLFKQYINRAPQDLNAKYALARLLVESGRSKGALEVIEPVLAAAPKEHRFVALAGDAYARGREYGRALEFYERAASLGSENAGLNVKAALVRLHTGDVDQGLADLETAMSLSKGVGLADEILVLTQLKRGKLDEARATVARLLKKAPDSPLALNLLGAVHIAEKDNDSARSAFRKALEADPGFFPAAQNLARLELREGNRQAARQHLEAVAAKSRSSRAYLELAKLAPRIGALPAEVEGWLKTARAEDPEGLEPLQLLVGHYLQTRQLDRAREVVEQALTRFPENKEVLNLAAQVQLIAGDTNQAITTYGRLAGQQGASAAGVLGQAKILLVNGKPAEAAEILRRLLKSNPSSLPAKLLLAQSELQLGRPEAALEIASALRKQHPSNPAGWILAGDVLFRQKKANEAIDAYERALKIRPSSVGIIKLHSAMSQQGALEEANKRLENWLLRHDSDSATRLYLAGVYSRGAQYKAATGHLEKLLERYPNDSVTLNNLAWAYLMLNDQRALPTAEKAYKAAPRRAEVADTFGWILVRLGKVGEGVEILEKAVSLKPKSAAIRFHYAQALLKSGDKTRARKELEALLREFPNFSRKEEVSQVLASMRQ